LKYIKQFDMSNTIHNSEDLKEFFKSLPVVDESRPDLRIINIEILESVVRHAENRASLAASMNTLAQAKDIVQEVFGKSLASL
jgi:lipoate synthase